MSTPCTPEEVGERAAKVSIPRGHVELHVSHSGLAGIVTAAVYYDRQFGHLAQALRAIATLPPGSKGAYSKFIEAQDMARVAIERGVV